VIKSNKTTVKEIKGLKPGKKYYVKVRTYKEVKSGTKKVRIYSDWSKKKAVQIKKIVQIKKPDERKTMVR
jgi:hypothetical protein